MDPDIAKWKRKQMDKNYCGECGGSGQQRIHLTGNPAIDYKTCTMCKGSGEIPSVKLKFGSYDRIGKPWIDFFENESITNEKDIQQPEETGITEPFKLTTVSGIVQEPRQRNPKTKRDKKPEAGRYAIPGTRGQNNPLLLQQGEIRQLYEK